MTDKSSRGVVFKTSLFITIGLTLLHYIVALIVPEGFSWWTAILVPLITFALTYIIVRIAFYRFIYKRIKSLYKAINLPRKAQVMAGRASGGPALMKATEEDVTQWTQDRIEEIRFLKETDLYRKEFIGNLAHELKTPIFSIQGYILTLLEDDALNDPNVNRKFLSKAAKGVDRIASLVEDLDSVAKIESGVFVPEFTRFNPVDLVHEVMESLEERARKHKISVVLDQNSNLTSDVEADKKRIEQVLVNLVSNSISYGNNGGQTSILVNDVGDHIEINVSDNGIGINEENQKRIFERFYRVDKSRSRQSGGSGLGLSIVKHIIEAHDQSIAVRSREGEGTTFTFTLKKAI